MRRAIAIIAIVLGCVAGGCDRSSGVSVPSPATLITLPSCDSLAGSTMALLQANLDAVADMTLDQLLDPVASGGRLADLDAAGDALTTRAAELGCEGGDLSAVVAARIDELHADGPLAERYLELVLERVGVAP